MAVKICFVEALACAPCHRARQQRLLHKLVMCPRNEPLKLYLGMPVHVTDCSAACQLQFYLYSKEAFSRHLARVPDYLWVAEDGMKMQGYCNSTAWDTSFAVQAIASTGLATEFASCLRKAHIYIEESQVRILCE